MAVPKILRVFSVAVASILGAACVQPQEATACLCHYRSPDWQVAHSPLIFVGRVERIKELPRNPNIHGELASARPSLAYVRVQRILKGRYEQATVSVRSGPIRSCSEKPCYFDFKVGDQQLFILPVYPEDGEAALIWGGSLWGLEDTGMIESRIARCVAYREAYLEEIENEQPKVLAAATVLAAEMREASKGWPHALPILESDAETGLVEHSKDTPEATGAEEQLAARLAKAGIEEIRTALALDWFCDEPRCWVRHPLWLQSCCDCIAEREEEFVSAERCRIRALLRRAGVEKSRIDRCLAAMEKEGRLRHDLEFPPPWPCWYGSDGEDDDEGVMTTDFIGAFHSYDRGSMVPIYLGNSADFSALDPVRVRPIVAALWGSDDQRLRGLAWAVIRDVPGTAFVDLVLTRFVEEDDVSAWHALEREESDQETSARLAAMLERASTKYTPWGVTATWSSLRRGECFYDVCIQKAIESLEQREAEARTKSPDQAAAKDDVVMAALQQYLDRAMRSREAGRASCRPAEDYRKWFAEQSGGEDKESHRKAADR